MSKFLEILLKFSTNQNFWGCAFTSSSSTTAQHRCSYNWNDAKVVCTNISQIKVIITIFRTTSNPFQHEVCQTSFFIIFLNIRSVVVTTNNTLKVSSLFQKHAQKHTACSVNAGFQLHCDKTKEWEQSRKVCNPGYLSESIVTHPWVKPHAASGTSCCTQKLYLKTSGVSKRFEPGGKLTWMGPADHRRGPTSQNSVKSWEIIVNSDTDDYTKTRSHLKTLRKSHLLKNKRIQNTEI